MERACLTGDKPSVTGENVTHRENEIDNSRLYEVTVKVLGFKSRVRKLDPSVRVVVALINDGMVSSKTALSTEFGALSEEDRMAMAVWDDKDTSESALFFDTELRTSHRGTFARNKTDLVVSLVDTSVDKETLLCKPVGFASWRIKASGDLKHATQLVQVTKKNAGGSISPFRVSNPYYKPDSTVSQRKRHFGQLLTASSPRLKHKPMLGMRKKTHQPLETTEHSMAPSESICATIESGILLLEVSWKSKENDLETVLDSAKLSILSNSRVVTPIRKRYNPQVAEDFKSAGSFKAFGDSLDELLGSQSSSSSPAYVHHHYSSQASTADMTETTRPISNTRKSVSTIEEHTISSRPSKSASTKSKKRFWIVPLLALKRRLAAEKLSSPILSTSPAKSVSNAAKVKKQGSATMSLSSNLLESSSSETFVAFPGVCTVPPQMKSPKKPTPRVQLATQCSPSRSVGKTSKERAENESRETGMIRQTESNVFTDDEILAIRPNFFNSKRKETRAESAPKDFPPKEVEFLQKDNPSGVSFKHALPPQEVVVSDQTVDNSSTITMRHLPTHANSKADNQAPFFNILPDCAIFDEDPSKLSFLEDYGNLIDDEETLATLETIDTYLKKKGALRGGTVDQSWFNDGGSPRNVEEELMSLGGFEYHEDTDILRARIPGLTDDDVSFVPGPEDVMWTELYKGCGVRSAEYLVDGLVLLPEKFIGLVQQKEHDIKEIVESPTLVSTSESEDAESEVCFDETVFESHSKQFGLSYVSPKQTGSRRKKSPSVHITVTGPP